MDERFDSADEDVKRLAEAGDMLAAINLYRQIHNVGLKDARDAVRQLAGLPPIPEKIGRIALSPGTKRRADALFKPEERAEVTRLLIEKCGDNLPDHERSTPQSLERIRFAALKWSGGDVSRLNGAIRLANTDWRDLLVAAEFANDPKAHEYWHPEEI